MAAEHRIAIPKVWRSEVKGIVLFLASLAIALYLSKLFPWSVLKGDIWRSSSTIVYLKLPLFWLLPASIFCVLMFRMYDVRYAVTPNGIESRTGILALRQVLVHVRFEDIRAIEVVQSLLDRMLDIGMIEISTSATGGIEILLEGIAAPLDVQNALLAERDERQRQMLVDSDKGKRIKNSEVGYDVARNG